MRRLLLIGALAALIAPMGAPPPSAGALPGPCSAAVAAIGYSDALDKQSRHGERLGGLSALAHDPRGRRYLALPDHVAATALIWPLTGLDDLPALRPRVAAPPIRLTDRGGRPVPGRADHEGLAVLSDGSVVVSSERGPTVTVYGRDGRWRDDLRVPPRYSAGAEANGSFEGLAATPSGRRLLVAMERPLRGEDPRLRRIIDYRPGPDGRLRPVGELAYRVRPGMRIAEIAAYDEDRLLVLETAYRRDRGSSAVLTAARIVGRRVLRTPVADLAACPTLGAPSREVQRNPLLDNYEGMTVSRRGVGHVIHLVSDDNYSPRQTTRVLTLWARLP
ncbi:MAG: esterase-like activity of phytase family protein [Gordonia sp. (in: high G+C Gram-positive bacteria)]|uniref:esterase-like activity of phytase family protein n=1 Tax=Gordonia sp. (in: high G+C Gram-positive bacteria) TaxID=84139 RepID=UPI0039E4D470